MTARRFLMMGALLVALAAPATAGPDNVSRNLDRIRAGAPGSLPPLETARATGGKGRGMTIVNDTPYALRCFFRGPVSKEVRVPRKSSKDVVLVVGRYDVGIDFPGAPVRPLFGRQEYAPRTHYWLKVFILRR